MDGLICLRAQWDRVVGAAFVLGGGLLLIDSGRQLTEAVYLANSFSFLTSGGFAGLAAVALGATLVVSAGFHDEWRKLDRIEAALRTRPAGTAPTGAPAGRVAARQWLRAEADRVAGWALVLAAGIWLVVGARLVAGALYAPKQVAYVISGGIGALFPLLLGSVALIVADTRDEAYKLGRIARVAGEAFPGEVERRRRATLVLPGVAVLVGGALIVGGWWRAADTLVVERAVEGLVLAMVGLVGSAGVLAVAVARERRRLSRQARQVLARVASGAAPAAPARPLNGSGAARWTAAGLGRFHRASCPVLLGAGQEPSSVAPGQNGLEPCQLCDAGVDR